MSAAPAEVLFHPDPLRLEAALAERVRAAQARSSPWARVLVLVPSLRLARRLRLVLPGRAGALLGVEVLQYQAWIHALAAREGPPLRIASDALLEHLLDRVVRDAPSSDLGAYASGRPAVLADLLARFSELREAGIAPGAVREAGTGALADLLARYTAALSALEGAGRTDRAGLTAWARRGLAGLPPYRALIAYGAYDLIGVNADLLRDAPSEEPVSVMVPGDLEAPAWIHARRSLERLFPVPPRRLDDPAPLGPFVQAARGLRDPAAPPAALPASRVRLLHAQGPEAELIAVTRRVLRLVARGIPPADIAVIARSLEPYRAAAPGVFERHGLAVDASVAFPLSRRPQVRAVLLLLEVLSRDFERRAVIELVRSPHLRATERAERGRWRPGSWDRWSRAFALVRGSRAWTEDLPAFLRARDVPPWGDDPEPAARIAAGAEEDAASAELLGRLVASWSREAQAWREAPSPSAFLRDLPARWIDGWEAGGDDDLPARWEEILDELAALERTRTPAPGEALAFVRRAVETAETAWSRDGGVAFLDPMQARGIPFRHLFLIGFNQGLFPRRVREHPLLPDALRERLRARTGRPLAVRREGAEEEWLLLAGLLAGTRKSLTVSWQRADADGKDQRNPSRHGLA